jgi:hypothetical protein
MALHRDIYWVGKQWAVTGHGIQACNQKQRGQYDIEASRLWVDGVQDAVRGLSWVNQEDFDKAIAAARKYFPEPSQGGAAPEPPVSPTIDTAPAAETEMSSPAKPAFDMRLGKVSAKLRPVWRVRPRGKGPGSGE